MSDELLLTEEERHLTWLVGITARAGFSPVSDEGRRLLDKLMAEYTLEMIDGDQPMAMELVWQLAEELEVSPDWMPLDYERLVA